jgi:predicted DNA-binding ribbon-helix-helix protein
MIRTQIQLTEEQSETLKQMAKDENVSVAELVRRSVDAYIDRHGGVSADERKRRLLSIIGIASSGETDLADDHDRYLEKIYGDFEQ